MSSVHSTRSSVWPRPTALPPSSVPREGAGGGARAASAIRGVQRHERWPADETSDRPRRHPAHGGLRCRAPRSPARPGGQEEVPAPGRSEEHTSELQSLMRISYAVFCLKKKIHNIVNMTKLTWTIIHGKNDNTQNNKSKRHSI